MREIEFDLKIKIGKFSAFDFFGDGSFFILDVPGVSRSSTPKKKKKKEPRLQQFYTKFVFPARDGSYLRPCSHHLRELYIYGC